ncbi:exodeoxyribonuclease VII small subunit [Longilinea arvoryzae]|uniref:Exodeoxyribonuclease 7 small subunit n=1 Tax=Longilinea arvoryzae TaxID=360412 RepID=A0A0S7BGB3_9CHLR|nr:exodeoxyribonuclease VII small subunit [Longilinea arvoryzae]GAP12833.1 exodeoxyribonuclease VII small subunit [Longilinea arvoryzae]
MTATAKPVDELNYEEAFAELETIVAALENSQQALEESLALFERGQLLAKRCADLLDSAELRVQQVNVHLPDLPDEDASEG